MTYEKAMQYSYLIREIGLIQSQLAELEGSYHVILETASPQGIQAYNDTWRILNQKLRKCESLCEEFERWLAAVPDRLIQTYMYMRFVDGMSWAKIGMKMNCKGPTARKAVQRYIQREEKQKE